MDYKRYIEQLEKLQQFSDRWMYLQLLNVVKAIGTETEKEEFKAVLRPLYFDIKKTHNPISLKDGSIIDLESKNKID